MQNFILGGVVVLPELHWYIPDSWFLIKFAILNFFSEPLYIKAFSFHVDSSHVIVHWLNISGYLFT